MKAKFGQLYIISENNDRKTTHIFLSEPTPLEEKNFGRVFSIIEIESQDATSDEIINLINEELVHNYYRSTELDIDVAFENAMHLLNRKLQQVTAELGEEWIKKLNASVAVIKGNELQFTQIGNLNIFIIQNKQIIPLHEKNKYNINPLKIFANISNGQLTDNSSIIFCTESLLDYLSQEKIKKTILENDPDEAVENLQELLESNNNSANFAAIIIKMLPLKEFATTNPIGTLKGEEKISKTTINEDADSMQKLVDQEASTNDLLSPSLWPSLKKNLEQWKSRQKSFKEINQDKKTIKNPSDDNWSYALLIGKKILTFLKDLSWQIITALIWLFRKIAGLFQNRREYSSKFSSLPNRAGGKINKTITWFKKLSTPRKAFIILFIIIIFFFAQSIIWQGDSKAKKEANALAAQNLSDATNKLGQADTKIIMNDLPGAKILVSEAQNLLTAIPADNNLDQSKLNAEKNKLRELSDKVNNVTRIDNPESVANFSSLNPAPQLNKISHISDYFYGFDQNNTSVYSYNTDTKAAEISTENKADKFTALTKDSAGSVLAVLNNQTFKQFSPVLKKLSDVTVGFDNKDYQIADLRIFSSKLYTLDVKNNQIFKHTKNGDNYNTGEAWLDDEDADLTDARSFAIDGSIYVLKNKGQVISLFGSELKTDWKLETVDAGIESATQIYTDENTDNLYVLDPANKRVVAYDKNDGKSVAQYTSDKWGDLKYLVVEQSAGSLYVLNGTEVFKVEI